jgi:hypothetical protein
MAGCHVCTDGNYTGPGKPQNEVSVNPGPWITDSKGCVRLSTSNLRLANRLSGLAAVYVVLWRDRENFNSFKAAFLEAGIADKCGTASLKGAELSLIVRGMFSRAIS